ncbi:MAG: arginine N-succinyltransferase [Kangiellaceae bacterium]|nr:arginine N-succinyltransferase [Kangiellaceae bacterium]
MIVIRPIKASDYDSLHQIAIDSGHGFTSLPINEDILKNKITRSETSFESNVKEPGDEGYLFVMEDTESGEIVGTSGVEAAVGLNSPFYHYHLGKVVHSSSELKVHNVVETLTLCNDFSGVTEICTLFLKEKARKNSNGRFLSRFRFLFIGEHEQRFSDRIIAEMRGVSDENGRSPFWEWLEKNFFSIDFPTADYLTGTGNKVFIAELMPKYPVYVSLLTKKAQAVINKVHAQTEPALRLLESEGFHRSDYVDIFDAGPTIVSQRQHIKTINQSLRLQVKYVEDNISEDENSSSMQQKYIMCNTKLKDFRAIQAKVTICDNDRFVLLPKQLADTLLVKENDWIRIIAN